MLDGWNTERVTALAPDRESVNEALTLAFPPKWVTLGHDDSCLWGTYQGSGKAPYEAKIDLTRLPTNDPMALHCTCPSRKKPCKHALALLLIAIQNAVSSKPRPAWVTTWLEKEAARLQKAEKKKAQGGKAPDPAVVAKNIAQRREKISAGLTDLELWLRNLIRNGLADPQLKNYAFWDSKAARMIDAQAPGLARWLTELGGLPKLAGDWLEPLLVELGLLYLLIESYKRFDSLPAGTQADIRTALGWHLKRDEIDPSGAVRDQWAVIAEVFGEDQERLRSRRLWLHGQQTGRHALILEFAFGNEPFETVLMCGSQVDADLIFFPSAYPLRAFIQQTYSEPTPIRALSGLSLLENLNAYGAALSKNPWLPQFPFILQAVYPVRRDNQWLLRETDGASLPLDSGFSHRWSMLAISGYQPLQVVGEWNGRAFWPRGAVIDGRFVNFNQVGQF